MSKQCFLDSARGDCVKTCMAYRPVGDQPGCSLLHTGEAISLLSLIFLKQPKGATKHPESAPPPKVNP